MSETIEEPSRWEHSLGKVSGTQSIHRTARVLRELAAADRAGMRLTDIAQRTGLEHPTAHRILKRLMVEGFVAQRRDTRIYTLGPLIYELGLAAARRYDIRGTCQEVLEELAQETGDTIFLNARSGFDAVCIDRKEGWFPIKTLVYEVGSRRPLGVGAGGIALMLSLSEDEVREIMRANSHRIAGYGTLTPENVMQMYQASKGLGYGLTEELAVPGVSAMAMPVMMDEGAAYAAVSVVAISSRMSDDRKADLLVLLREKVQKLEQALNESHSHSGE